MARARTRLDSVSALIQLRPNPCSSLACFCSQLVAFAVCLNVKCNCGSLGCTLPNWPLGWSRSSSLSLCLCPALGFNCANLVAEICGEMLKCFAFGCSDWRENEFIAYGDSEREGERAFPRPNSIKLSENWPRLRVAHSFSCFCFAI